PARADDGQTQTLVCSDGNFGPVVTAGVRGVGEINAHAGGVKLRDAIRDERLAAQAEVGVDALGLVFDRFADVVDLVPRGSRLERLTHDVHLRHEVADVRDGERQVVATFAVAPTGEKPLVFAGQVANQLLLSRDLCGAPLHHHGGHAHLR